MAAFSQARVVEKGEVQPLATWNRIVNECWESETDEIKAKIDTVRNERIEQLRREWVSCKDGPSTIQEQILYVREPMPGVTDVTHEALGI
jgi:hypothetical protein